MKYTLEFKLKCIELYKKARVYDYPNGVDRASFRHMVGQWAKKFDDLGIDGLKHSNQNKVWTSIERFDLVVKVVAGHSISSISKEANINPGQLYQWVKIYREKGTSFIRRGCQHCHPGRYGNRSGPREAYHPQGHQAPEYHHFPRG